MRPRTSEVWLDLKRAEQLFQPEPQAARFLKSKLVGGGPVNRDVRQGMHKYFQPSRLGQWRGRSVYEFFGVRFFKRYLLPTELLIQRLRSKWAIGGGKGALKAELERLDWETRRNESIHLFAMLVIACILVYKAPSLSIEQALWIFGINLYVNIYPIFVQRYNRFRIARLSGRHEQ